MRAMAISTFPVIVNICDASPFNLNRSLRLGFYRSAIEVHNREYMFFKVQNNPDNADDIASRLLSGPAGRYIAPPPPLALSLCKSTVVGRTNFDTVDAKAQVHYVHLGDYDDINNNCCHFVDRACAILGVRNGFDSVPWVRRLTWMEPRLSESLCIKMMVKDDVTKRLPIGTVTYPVLLNVYEVGVTHDHRRRFLGFVGFYRSMVEVHGMEYMFCENRGVAGISAAAQRAMADAKGLTLKETIMVGRTRTKLGRMEQKVTEMAKALAYLKSGADLYDYISKNSHHFSDDLYLILTGNHIPSWLKTAALIERTGGEGLTPAEVERRANLTPRPRVELYCFGSISWFSYLPGSPDLKFKDLIL